MSECLRTCISMSDSVGIMATLQRRIQKFHLSTFELTIQPTVTNKELICSNNSQCPVY